MRSLRSLWDSKANGAAVHFTPLLNVRSTNRADKFQSEIRLHNAVNNGAFSAASSEQD